MKEDGWIQVPDSPLLKKIAYIMLVALCAKWFLVLVFYLNYKHQSLDDFSFLFDLFEFAFGSWLPAIYRSYDCLLDSGYTSKAHYILLVSSLSWLIFVIASIWIVFEIMHKFFWVFPNMSATEKKKFIDQNDEYERRIKLLEIGKTRKFLYKYFNYFLMIGAIYMSIFGDFDEERLCGIGEVASVPVGLTVLLGSLTIFGCITINRRITAKLLAEGIS